jgi:hypothetical protein
MSKKLKLKKKLKKLNDNLYKNNKYVTKEEFLCSRMPKSLKTYYNKLSDEMKKALVSYIIKREELDGIKSLRKIETNDPDDDIKVRKTHSILEAIDELKKYKKRKKKKLKFKNVIKGTKGLLHLLNPEAFDQTLLNRKDYRKQLKKLAEKEQEEAPVELDCTLKNFHKELMKNDSVNQEVMNGFWNKFGYD